jgi:hypothetical protein
MGLGLRRPTSENLEDSPQVMVSALLVSARRHDAALEQIIGRVSLEPLDRVEVIVHLPDLGELRARWQAAPKTRSVAPHAPGSRSRCGDAMKKLKLTRERQERFLEALGETGIVSGAGEIAGTSRTRMYELWKRDTGFAAG